MALTGLTMREFERRLNRFFGFLIPVALIGVAAYSIWVVTVTACGTSQPLQHEESRRLVAAGSLKMVKVARNFDVAVKFEQAYPQWNAFESSRLL